MLHLQLWIKILFHCLDVSHGFLFVLVAFTKNPKALVASSSGKSTRALQILVQPPAISHRAGKAPSTQDHPSDAEESFLRVLELAITWLP